MWWFEGVSTRVFFQIGAQTVGLGTALLALLVSRVLFNWYIWEPERVRMLVRNSCLFIGRVKHTRFYEKRHHLSYPLFFSCIDLAEVEKLGWLLWPIFKVDGGCFSFCSLDKSEHLKDFNDKAQATTLFERACAFVSSKSTVSVQCIKLLSHLTYFGYCFNPISIYYVNGTEAIIAEVSNTPWGEMHPYMLHSSVEGVEVKRVRDSVKSADAGKISGKSRSKSRGTSRSRSRTRASAQESANQQDHPSISLGANSGCTFQATWRKEFHVSPFMEMNYNYTFSFSEPGDTIAVYSQLHNIDTQQLAFTASFEMERIDFTPLNLLYVLIFYPLHTRVIQIWIHIEAAILWWKGVTFFPHPLGHDVDLGWGITGERLAGFFGIPILAAFAGWFAKSQAPITSSRSNGTRSSSRHRGRSSKEFQASKTL